MERSMNNRKHEVHPPMSAPKPTKQTSNLQQQQPLSSSANLEELRPRAQSLGSSARRNAKYAPPPLFQPQGGLNDEVKAPAFAEEQDSELNGLLATLQTSQESDYFEEEIKPAVLVGVPYLHKGTMVTNRGTQTINNLNNSIDSISTEIPHLNSSNNSININNMNNDNAIRRVASLDATTAELRKREV